MEDPDPADGIQAGWYPDPDGTGHYRYWSGRSWTRDVATCSPVTLAAMAGAGPTPPAPSAVVPSEPDWELALRASKGRGRGPWIATLASVAVVVALVACVTLLGTSSSEPPMSPAAAQASIPAVPSGPGGSTPSRPVRSTTVPAVPAPPAGHASADADQATAQRSLLRLSDLPTGWTAVPDASPVDGMIAGSGGAAQFSSCVGQAASSQAGRSTATPRFDGPGGMPRVQDSVTVFTSQRDATADFATAANPRMPSCLGQLLGDPATLGLRAGQTLGKVTGSSGPVGGFGTPIEAIDVTLPIVQRAGTVPFHVTLFVILVGRTETVLTEGWVGTQLPAALSQPLLRTVIQRMGSGPAFT